jgi:hypothetical protein
LLFLTFSEGKTPPYSPTFTPPASYFASPAGMISIYSTAFMPTTGMNLTSIYLLLLLTLLGLWALNDIGAFNHVITNSNLPPKITYKLNTNVFYAPPICLLNLRISFSFCSAQLSASIRT